MSLVETVRTQLAELPDLYALLPMYRLPGSLPPDPDARRATTNPSRPTVVLDIVDLTDTRPKRHSDDFERSLIDRRAGARRLGVLPTLRVWVAQAEADMCDGGYDHQPPTDLDTVTGVCAWLHRYANWVTNEYVDFADDVAWLYRDVRKAVGERDPIVFSCPKCGWRIEPQDDATWFRCTGCPQTWRMDAEIRRLGATQPDMPLREVARRLGRSLGTLRDWAAQGKILPVGRRGNDFLYDLERVRQYSESRTVRTG